MPIDISKRQADRLRVLEAIFVAAHGIEREPVRIQPTIQTQLELSDEELLAACAYLAGEGLIRPIPRLSGTYVFAELTHRGVIEREKAISTPDKPTRYLPPAFSIISINNSTIIGSPVQSASPDASQTSTSDLCDESLRSRHYTT